MDRFVEEIYMNTQVRPGAWAIVRNMTYLYGNLAILALVILGSSGLIGVGITEALACLLIPVVLLANYGHIWAILTGNTNRQKFELQAWSIASKPITNGFQAALHNFRGSYKALKDDHPLREVGSIGVDLTRTRQSSRQSGGRGTGGHKKPASSGSDDDGDGGESLPLIWTIHDLAAVLQVSVKTLQNKPQHKLPPAIRIPGCRGPRYHCRDVLAWLDSFQSSRPTIKTKKPLGRPRIALSLGKGGSQ